MRLKNLTIVLRKTAVKRGKVPVVVASCYFSSHRAVETSRGRYRELRRTLEIAIRWSAHSINFPRISSLDVSVLFHAVTQLGYALKIFIDVRQK